MPGGMLFDSDYPRLCESVLRVANRFGGNPPRFRLPVFLETGVYQGLTSRDLIKEIATRLPSFVYYGIDPEPCPDDMPEQYTHIQGLSHSIFINSYDNDHGDGVPYPIHWAMIDSCHCAQCCMRDAIFFGSIMEVGGEMCFHDASARMQGRDPQNYHAMEGHHDSEIAARDGIQVRKALDSGLIPGIKLIQRAPDNQLGGVDVWEKI